MSERLTNTGSSVPSQPPGSVTGADSVDGEANRLAGQAMSVHEGKKPASVRAKVSGLISQARSAYNRFTANFSGKKADRIFGVAVGPTAAGPPVFRFLFVRWEYF